MATVAKFYLLDAATSNTGTMPSGAFAFDSPTTDADATSRNARDATDVAGTSNPDLKSTLTAAANTSLQFFGHRRFVSRPLAAHTFAVADGNWTFSYARKESNTAHHGQIRCVVDVWRPSTGLIVGVGTNVNIFGAAMTSTSEVADSATAAWSGTLAILDGDILRFEVYSEFTQTMSSAYTDSFSYGGTTEANTTTCASFVSPPVALTLFTGGTTYTKAGYGAEHA
jgi:hypothetical protein